jgi:hypothetical protein
VHCCATPILGTRDGVSACCCWATPMACCNTGFCTWVDLTDCMMMGDWVLACLADQAALDMLDLLLPLRMLLTGLGAAGRGLVGVGVTRWHWPPAMITLG